MSGSDNVNIPEICHTCMKHAWNISQIAEGDHCDICNKWFCNNHILIKSQTNPNEYYTIEGVKVDLSRIDISRYLIDHANSYVFCYKCGKL